MKIGHKIKKIREIKGFTREYMAAQLEMSVSNYGKLERDEIPITLEKLQLISESLDVNYLDILSFDEKQVFNFFNNGTHAQGYLFSKHHNHPPSSSIEELTKRIDELEKLIREQQDKS